MPYPNHPLRAPLYPKRQPPKAPFYTLMSPNAATFPGGMSVREAWADRSNKIQDLDGTDGPVIKPSPGRDRELMNILDFMESKDRTLDDVAPNPDKTGNGVSLLDSPDEGTWSKIKEMATNIGERAAVGLLGLIPESMAQIPVDEADRELLDNYITYYYAGKKDVSDNARKQLEALRDGSLSIPTIATDAINIAVDIFGTDYGKGGKARKQRYGEDRLRADLERLGAIESEYVHLKNLDGGSDSGYWQVQPLTAWNSLRDAPDHFGKDFDEKFAPEGWSYDELLQMTEDQLQTLMRKKDKKGNPVPINQALVASFAAVKILQTFDY